VNVTAASLLMSLATAAQQTAIPADTFVDSTGINIHLSYTNTAYYTNWPLIRDSLVKLGIRHVRDGFANTTLQAYYDRHNELGSLGMKGDFTTNGSQDPSILESWPNNVAQSFESFENVNEADLSSDYLSVLDTTVPALYNEVRASVFPNAKVIGPSLTNTNSYAIVGNLSQYFDYGNLHNYVGGRNPGTPGWTPQGYGSIPFAIQYERFVSGTKPIITTETGYVNSLEHATWIPEDVMGVYMPRLYLEQWLGGISRTYVYELLSEGNEDFGLMRADTSYKSAYFATSNLLNLLSDRGAPFTPGSLTYTLNGADSTVHKLLMQKRNGDFYLALWIEQPMYDVNPHTYITVPTQAVTLQTPQSFASATVYQIDVTGAMSATNLPVSTSMPLVVSDKVMVVKLQKTASSTQTWTLQTSVSPSNGGTIVVTPPAVNNKYALNSPAMLTAVPNPGFAFDQFSGSVSSTAGYVTLNSATATTLSESASFHCSYKPAATTSTFAGTGGTNTIAYTTGAGCADKPTTSASWLTATAAGGMLSITTQPDTNVTRAATVTLGDAAIQVTETTSAATWKLNVAVSPAAAGTVTTNPATIDYKFLPNTSVTLSATANSGFTFKQFSGVVTALQPNVTVTSSTTGNMTETAVFSCDYSLPFPSLNIPAVGVNRTQTYTSGPGCTNTPVVSANWLTASLTGTNSLSINSATNTGATRVGTVTLGNAVVTLTQAGTAGTKWTLNTAVSPAAGGTITATPASADGTYAIGTSVSLLAKPSSGYVFVDYTGTASSSSPTLSVTSTTTATETALFRCTYAPSTTAVTTTAAGGGTTVPFTTGSGCTTGAVSSATWLSATAANGALVITTQANTGSASRAASITLGDAVVNVTQSAGGTFKINLSASPSVGGTVTTTPAVANGTFAIGTTVTLTATANPGYVFSEYTGAFPSSSPTLSIAPKSSATELAVFRCTYSLAPAATGAISASGGTATVNYSTGSTCTDTPAASVTWLSATASQGVLTIVAQPNSGTARTGIVTLGDATQTVTQNAAGAVTGSLASNVPGSSIGLDGSPYPLASTLRWMPGSVHTLSAPIQKVNGVVYVLGQWVSGTSGTTTETVTVPGTNVTYGTQLVAAIPLSAAPTAGGAITYSDPGQAYGGFLYYPPQAPLTLTAIPNQGCTFLQWSGSTNSTSAQIVLSMDSTKNELAKFTCQ
jgi:hypothetical protein